MARCAGFKLDGNPCERIVGASQRHCYAHDPARAAERRRNAAKAGRSKSSREVEDLKRQLEDLAQGVLSGRVDRGDAAVVTQVLNARARLVELERKIREREELEARLEALEEAALEEREAGGRQWGT